MHVGNLIRNRRQSLKLSLFGAYEKTGVRPATISQIERTGKGGFSLIFDLARGLGIESIPINKLEKE